MITTMKLTPEIIEYIKHLYHDGNSSNDIVELVNEKYKIKVCSETIRKQLKINGVPIRNRKEAVKLSSRKHLPMNEIIKLYTENKISLKWLSKRFKSSKSTIHKILAENKIRVRTSEEVITANRKFERHPFKNDDNEKAYLTGFAEGDITAYRKSKYTIRLITNSTHKSFAELIKKCFCVYGNVKVSPAKNRTMGGYMWRIRVDLDNSFNFLLPDKRKEFIKKILSTNDNGIFLDLLAGLVDSDGSLIIRKAYDNFQFVLRIFGEDAELMKGLENKLKFLGFMPHSDITFKKGLIRKHKNIVLRYNHDYITLELSNRKDIIRLIENLPIRHSEKIPRKDLIIRLASTTLKKWDDVKGDVETLKQKNEEDIRKGLLEAEIIYARSHPKVNDR